MLVEIKISKGIPLLPEKILLSFTFTVPHQQYYIFFNFSV